MHVDDVATGHLLAMEKGVPGESYILAGEVATFEEALTGLAELTGGRKPLFLPKWLVRTAAGMNGALERVVRLPQDQTREAMLASTATYYGTSDKAERELGWTPRSLEEGFAETYLAPPVAAQSQLSQTPVAGRAMKQDGQTATGRSVLATRRFGAGASRREVADLGRLARRGAEPGSWAGTPPSAGAEPAHR